MANTIRLEIVTPDRMVVSEDVQYVGAPGIYGEFGVLPGHIPFLSALGIGSLYFKKDGRRHFVFIAGGFAEVSSNKVTVLAEVSEKAEEIDIERAKRAKERAEQRLNEIKDRLEYTRARAALMRSIARMSTRETSDRSGSTAM